MTQIVSGCFGRVLYIQVVLVLAIGLGSCKRIIKNGTRVGADVSSMYLLDTTAHFDYGWNAAWGYCFALPMEFIEQIDNVAQIDSIVYYSEQKTAKLIYFVEGDISGSDTTRNFLREYFLSPGKGQHMMLSNCEVIDSYFSPIARVPNHSGYFTILGRTGEKEFIWKTLLTQIPVSGDFTYSTMLFSYPITKGSHYQPIGATLANEFMDVLKQ